MSSAGIGFIALTFSGAVLALLLSLGQLLIRNRNRGNLILSAIYGAIAFQQIHTVVFRMPGTADALPHLALAGPLARYILGPLLLLFFRDILLEQPLRKRWPHFVPVLFLFSGGLPFFLGDLFSLMGGGACDWCRPAWFRAAANLAALGSDLSLMIYLGPLTLFLLRSRPDLTSGRRVLRAVAMILALSIVAVLANIAHWFSGRLIFSGIGSVLLTLVMYAVFLLGYVYSEVLHVMRMEAYEERKSPSLLKGLDTDRLASELRRLMEEEQLFLDEDLQLKTVAAALEIRPNQLTYLLNHVHEKNFAGFVNEYRVQAARKLLVEEPSRSVLSIGFAVGFNSKAAFYRVFGTIVGQSPNAYRKSARV